MSTRAGVPERLLIVAIRAAAGPDVGFGHLMRAVALAEGLQQRGAEPVVLMSDNPVDDATLRTLTRGARVERIAALTLTEDARATVQAMTRLGASVAITDVCTTSALTAIAELDAFHQHLKQHAPFLMVFAAGRHLDPSADVVVNPYLMGTPPAASTGRPSARVLSGPAYFIFRPEFIRAAQQPRAIAEQARRIVVAVGGSDPASLTTHILDALSRICRDDVAVKVVVGPGMDKIQRIGIDERIAAHGGDWQTVMRPGDMAALFMWADLAVTGDGLTKYETAVTGTPSVIVARPDSDPRINEAFMAGGTTLCVTAGADGTWPALRSTIRRVIESTEIRQEMSRRGRELTDGRGLERVLDHLPRTQVA